MIQLFRLYLQMAMLRAAPQDAPGGRDALLYAVAAALITYVAAIAALHGLGEALARAVLDVGVLASLLHAGLRITDKLPRFPQALAAFCGTGAIINLAAWPLLASMGSQTEAGNSLVSISLLLMYIWSVLVGAHLFRHTFDTSFPVGVLVSLGYVFLSVNITAIFFGNA